MSIPKTVSETNKGVLSRWYPGPSRPPAPVLDDQQLRDQFTCAALTGLLASSDPLDDIDDVTCDYRADKALELADVVMKKRQKGIESRRELGA